MLHSRDNVCTNIDIKKYTYLWIAGKVGVGLKKSMVVKATIHLEFGWRIKYRSLFKKAILVTCSIKTYGSEL